MRSHRLSCKIIKNHCKSYKVIINHKIYYFHILFRYLLTFAIPMLCCVVARENQGGNNGGTTIEKAVMEQNTQLQFSSLGHNLLIGQYDPSGDPLIKRIFSNQEVLAWLLVHFIDEYRGFDVREVMEKYLPQAAGRTS